MEKMGPTCLPDRASPLGIGGTQSTGEPPKMRGGRGKLPSMLSLSPFSGQAREQALLPDGSAGKGRKTLTRFPARLVHLPKCGFFVVVFFPFLGYSRNVSLCNSYFIVCNMFTRPFTIKTRGKDFCRLWKQQTNVITCFCFSLLFITVMSPGPKSHDITLCLCACLSADTLYKI